MSTKSNEPAGGAGRNNAGSNSNNVNFVNTTKKTKRGRSAVRNDDDPHKFVIKELMEFRGRATPFHGFTTIAIMKALKEFAEGAERLEGTDPRVVKQKEIAKKVFLRGEEGKKARKAVFKHWLSSGKIKEWEEKNTSTKAKSAATRAETTGGPRASASRTRKSRSPDSKDFIKDFSDAFEKKANVRPGVGIIPDIIKLRKEYGKFSDVPTKKMEEAMAALIAKNDVAKKKAAETRAMTSMAKTLGIERERVPSLIKIQKILLGSGVNPKPEHLHKIRKVIGDSNIGSTLSKVIGTATKENAVKLVKAFMKKADTASAVKRDYDACVKKCGDKYPPAGGAGAK